MQTGNYLHYCHRFIMIFVFVLFISPIYIINSEQEIVMTSKDISFVDEMDERIWDVNTGDLYSININCQDCTTELLFNNSTIASQSSNYLGEISEPGLLKLRINNFSIDAVKVSALIHQNDEFLNTRPGPTDITTFTEIYECEQKDGCIDLDDENLATKINSSDLTENYYVTGINSNEDIDYFTILVEQGDIIELGIAHSSSDLSISMFYQNPDSEQNLGVITATDMMINWYEAPNTQFVNFENQGRVIVKVESQTINAQWALKIIRHQTIDSEVIDLAVTNEIFGHGNRTIILDSSETQAALFLPTNNDIEYTYWSLVDSEWLFTKNGLMLGDEYTRLYPLPTASAIKIKLNATSYHSIISLESFGDLNSAYEAPSLPPILQTTNNSSWPLIDFEQTNNFAQFTNSIGDYSDVYRIEITAWEDSIHFIKFEIQGAVELFEIELISKDIDDWSDIESKTRTQTSGDLQVAMEVPRGTHFFRISLVNANSVNSWGEYTEPHNYQIITTYELVDEGEEPWFPPDENAKKWGSFARWFMGLVLLIPAAYLLLSYRGKQHLAKELHNKEQRLDWLKSQLDKGISPRKNQKSLAKSLDIIAILDWDDACQTWGEPDLMYRTEGVAISVWKLDPRIVKNEGCVPILVGIYIIEGEWEIAALKLDSVEGNSWEIKSVTPRFLFARNELFLDTMNPGNKTFISVELKGESSAIAIELNGRLNGEPAASRVPKVLLINSEEE